MNKKEAIEIIKKNWPDSRYTMLREALQTLIPELKESEDEKIIRTLKEIVNWGCAKNISVENNVELKDCLAWIEKQSEQKSQGKSAFELWKDMRFEVYQQASGNRHEPNCSDDSTKMFSLNDIDEIFEKVAEKQGEQKPTDKVEPKFKVGDSIRYKNSGAIFTIKSVFSDHYSLTNNEGLLYFKFQDKYELVEQKPSWSKEDEKLYTSALWHIKNSCGNGGNDSGEYEVYNWLKSIKDRIQPQQKQEWSEEDEKMWLQVINEMEAIKSNSSTIFEKNIAEEKIDWLKSIKSKKHWKPSEEQMEALFEAKLASINNREYFLGLLYEDLKKL